jgi:hypothetical protein
MKFQEALSRITGFSVPVFGLQWNPPEAERAVAHRVLAFLEDRRVLYVPSEMEVPSHGVQSVLRIREFLTSELGKRTGDGQLTQSLRAMRAACRKFLDAVGPEDGPIVRHGFDHGHYASWEFNQALGELRGVFDIYISILAATYGFDIEAGLAAIVPGRDDEEGPDTSDVYDNEYLSHLLSLQNGQARVQALIRYKKDSYHLTGSLKSASPLDVNLFLDLMSAIRAKSAVAFTVYRMTSDHEFHVNLFRYLKEREIVYPAFMSTSLVEGTVSRFKPDSGTPLLLEIEIPEDFPFAPMEVKDFSGEDEILLPCGTTFTLLEARFADNDKKSIDRLRLEAKAPSGAFATVPSDQFLDYHPI